MWGHTVRTLTPTLCGATLDNLKWCSPFGVPRVQGWSPEDICGHLLQELLDATDSSIGFIASAAYDGLDPRFKVRQYDQCYRYCVAECRYYCAVLLWGVSGLVFV